MIYRLLQIATGAAFLASCQTPTVTKTETVEVKIPVAVQPIKPEQIPAPPAALPKRPASPSAALDLLMGKWCEAVGYIVQADPLLRISAGADLKAVPKFPECER